MGVSGNCSGALSRNNEAYSPPHEEGNTPEFNISSFIHTFY